MGIAFRMLEDAPKASGQSRRSGNIGGLLSDNSRSQAALILNIHRPAGRLAGMEKTLPLLALLMGLTLASQASAQCYADFKAKQDNPLRLQYGIIELPASACGSRQEAASYAAPVIARSGWTLLQIESIFGASEFQSRSAHAGVIHRRQ